MEQLLVLATSNGIVIAGPEGDDWQEVRRGLEAEHATSVIAREGVILAGTRAGVFRSDDLGSTWQIASAGLAIAHVRWLAFHPQISDREFAGTEPAGIFVSHDGGVSWRDCPEVVQMGREYGWSLPYSPEAGCVRGLAFSSSRGYAAVEDGCVLLSDDHGETWRLAPGSRGRADHFPRPPHIHSDVHTIEVHPSSPDRVVAPTGGGFFLSDDGGKTWVNRFAGCYCRAVWWDSQDPDHLILGPADGVDRDGRIEETRDGGRSWQPASQGLGAPWPRHMVERFHASGEGLFAVLSNGELIAAPLENLEWRRVLPQITDVNAVTTMEEGRTTNDG
jgi:photosystem II stability/assembly factor-like uncharacterized protein